MLIRDHGCVRMVMQSGMDHVVAEAAVTVFNSRDGLVDLLQRKPNLLEDRKINKANFGHVSHVLALASSEPHRAIKRLAQVHHCVQIDWHAARDRADVDSSTSSFERPHASQERFVRSARTQAVDEHIHAIAGMTQNPSI